MDVAIIGGGVNGLAIARDAAARGLRTIVFERADISSGTTSTSSRLVHGGLKYLEQYEFELVRESIRERHLLFRSAPHLVHDYPMLIPFYRANTRPGALIRLGLAAFDVLSLNRGRGRSRKLTTAQVSKRWPSVSTEGLRGAGLFIDAQIPWAERLCVELMLDAERLGARVLTRTRVTDLIRAADQVVGVRVSDASGETHDVHAAMTVNAAGPWIDEVLTGQVDVPRLNGGTKGSHLLVEEFPGAPDTCILFEAASDRRPVFVLPWAGRYWLGSTDLKYDGDLDDVRASGDEIQYLLSETNRLIPAAKLTSDDVVYSVSGIRPLPYAEDVTDNSKISRKHQVLNHAPDYPGLITIIGGKLTTHRALGEEATDEIVRALGRPAQQCVTRRRPLPGGDTPNWSAFCAAFTEASPLSAEQSRQLLDVYGVRAQRIVDLVVGPSPGESANLKDPKVPKDWTDQETRVLTAEVTLAVTEERASTVSDVLLRRALHRLGSDMGLSILPTIARTMSSLLGWDDDRARHEMAAYREEISYYQPRILGASASHERDRKGRGE